MHRMPLDNLDATVLYYLHNDIMSLGMRPEGGRDGGKGGEGGRGRRNYCLVSRLARRKRGGMRQR